LSLWLRLTRDRSFGGTTNGSAAPWPRMAPSDIRERLFDLRGNSRVSLKFILGRPKAAPRAQRGLPTYGLGPFTHSAFSFSGVSP
jgi:hypothetical protein